MKPGDEDEAWRQIVENYGDRPQVDDDADEAVAHLEDRPLPEPPAAPAGPTPDPTSESGPRPFDPGRLWEEADTFVPPPVAALPLAEPKRLVAWIGIFVVPAVYLVAVVAQLDYPGLADVALLAWLIGGFGYLVWTMPKRPHDPWDDGSRL